MTFREMLQIERYIQQLEELKQERISGNELKRRANMLNGQIMSGVKGYEPKGIDWNAAWVGDSWMNGHYDAEKGRDNLDIMCAALQGILNCLPYYDEVCDLNKDISYGKNIIGNPKCKREFIVEKIKKYSHNIKFEQAAIVARESLLAGEELVEEQIDSIFSSVVADIETYCKSLFEEKRDLKEVVQPTNPHFQIFVSGGNATANASASAQVTVDISVQIEQTIEQVKEACLKPEEEAAIVAKLDELKGISQEKNRRTKWDKIKGVFQWLAEQGLQVAGWLVPLIYQIMQGV